MFYRYLKTNYCQLVYNIVNRNDFSLTLKTHFKQEYKSIIERLRDPAFMKDPAFDSNDVTIV